MARRRKPTMPHLLICQGCGTTMTPDEVNYLSPYCNVCAAQDWERLKAWKAGGDDPELDEQFSDKKTVH